MKKNSYHLKKKTNKTKYPAIKKGRKVGNRGGKERKREKRGN